MSGGDDLRITCFNEWCLLYSLQRFFFNSVRAIADVDRRFLITNLVLREYFH